MNDEGKPTARLDIALTTVGKLADIARQDPDFLQVGELYRDDPAFDVTRLVAELVEAESVPLLPILRYKPSGLASARSGKTPGPATPRRCDLAAARTDQLSYQGRPRAPSRNADATRLEAESRSARFPSRPSTRAPTS